LPFLPTVARIFATADHVGALLRVHQPEKRPVAVQLETQVLDAAGDVVASDLKVLEASTFSGGAGVEHRFELPLRALGAWDYLLRCVATGTGKPVTREVRFSIR
jgi:hypothetical protein